MTSPARLERPRGLDPAFGYYSPPVTGQEAAAVPVLDAWYAVYPDTGMQSIFEAGVTEVVLGSGERQRVPNTVIEPFKWVAMLDIRGRSAGHGDSLPKRHRLDRQSASRERLRGDTAA